MPKHYIEDFEQDWEPVVWKQNKTTSKSILDPSDNFFETSITLGKQIKSSRQRAHMTKKDLCQSLGIKLKELEAIELDEIVPKRSQMVKINRILNCRIKY